MHSLGFTFQVASLKSAQAMQPSSFTHACQILDSRQSEAPLSPFPNVANHALRLRFDDEIMDTGSGKILPSTHDIDAIIGFGRDIPRGASVLFHCYSGVSRSTAAAFIVTVCHLGIANAKEAARLVSISRPRAEPNRLMLLLADDRLNAHGSLLCAGQRLCWTQRETREALLGGGWI